MGIQIPQGEEAIFVAVRAIQKHWQSSLHRSLQRCCKKDHSIANNVMQQKGLFSMPVKLKQYSKNF